MGLFDFLFGKKKTASEPKETAKQPNNSGLPTFKEVSKKYHKNNEKKRYQRNITKNYKKK